MTALAQRPEAPASASAQEPTPGDLLTSWQRIRLILVLGTLIAVGPLTIDMYLPALPAIGEDLQTTAAGVQLTLTGTLIGLAVGQLIIGPLSDVLGRKRPLLAGTALHVLASILCVIAPNIAVLGGLRVVQGFGAAAASVIAMAVVRDLFDGIAFARILSRLLLVMGVAPVLAPTLGSALLNWTQWRGVFAALAVLGVALIAVTAFGLGETLPPHRRRPARVLDTLRVYGGLLRDRTFIGLVLVAGFAMAALFAYVAGSSFVLQEQYGLNEQQFGIAFGAGAIGMITATQLNVRLLRHYSPQQILLTSLVAALTCGLVLLGFAATNVGGLPGVLIPLWAVLAATGFALPNAPALALAGHGEAAGTAAALLGAVQFGVGALAAPVVGLLGNGSTAMAAVITGGMLIAVVVLLAVVRPGRLPALDREGRSPVASVH
ncbi:multidrug effflux MFS transporter [Micromonospora sp. NBC_01813]|uniref:multidrug effflux MFS transporter n=1 Tax=Micromonospora sp. NBC_01813 TaxID=2975988 RepID=UPI002DD7A450|nr:multidrug effflux MFS transporter [Micromonospora sp. NBC_01813]WSA06943.1 multidrug effflux MFS transporter [Micromonospora sp. NBC_01813]